MPLITPTKLNQGEPTTITVTVLDGSDTLTYQTNAQRLTLHNPTGGAITANLLGSGVSGTHQCVGGGEIDLSLGFDMSVGAGDTVAINLSTIRNYLGAAGNTVDLTNASTLEATLVTE